MKKHNYGISVAMLLVVITGHAFCQPEEQLSLMAKKALSGETLSSEVKDTCDKHFLAVREKNVENLKDGKASREECATVHYVNSIKMAAINPASHGGWPVKHGGRAKAYSILKKMLKSDDDVHLLVAAIIPALDNADATFAVSSYKRLKSKDALWAEFILEVIRVHYPSSPAEKEFLAEAFKERTATKGTGK
jgi:hypothetical protein